MGERDAQLPLNDPGQQPRALLGRAVARDEAAGEHDGTEEGLEHESDADLFHHDHDFDRATEAAVLLRQTDAEDTELRESLPDRVTEAVRGSENSLASLEAVLAG